MSDGTSPPSGLPLPDRVEGWIDGYGYLRISDDPEGIQAGVERQEEDIRKKASAERINLVGIYWDDDIGASTLSKKTRPDYDAMIAELRNGNGRAIVAYANGRLTRRPKEWLELIDLANNHGVIIRTCVSGQHDLTTADGRAVAITIAAWDAAEVERLSERLKRAQLQEARKGRKHQGIHRVFGYDREFNEIAEEAAVVREVFNRRAKGESLTAIAHDLNTRGITTVKTEVKKGKNAGKTIGGGSWDASKISSMIRRHDYIGEIAVKGEVIGPAAFEPLVDRATWILANQLVEESSNRGNNTRKALLAGFLVCGNCHAKMKSGQTKDGPVYRCPGPKSVPGSCGSCSITARKTDYYVIGAAQTKFQQLPYVPENKNVRDFKAEADALQAEIDQLQSLREANRIGLGDYVDELDRLRKRQAKLAREEAAAVSLDMGPYLQPFLDYWDSNLSQQRVWLDSLISYVVVSKADPSLPKKGFKPQRLEVHFKDGTSVRLSKGRVVDRFPDGLPEPQEAPACSQEGCSRPRYAKGLCQTHYKAAWRRAKRESGSE